MRYLRVAGEQVLGLFVADWTQTIGILIVLGLAWLAIARIHVGALVFVVPGLLAAHLVYTTLTEARTRARRAAGPAPPV